MKHYFTTFFAATIVATSLAIAQEKEAGKASDGATNKAQPAPAREAGAGAPKGVEPGKASDATTEKSAARKFAGKVIATNAGANTVTIEDDQNAKHELHIGSSTKLKKGDAEATFSDIKVGESVEGTSTQKGETKHAETLTIGG